MATPSDWSHEDAAELYRLEGWSDGFFGINEAGRVAARRRFRTWPWGYQTARA